MSIILLRRRYMFRAALLCGLAGVLSPVPPAAVAAGSGAGYSHEIRQWIDAAGRDPAKAAQAITVIVEADPGTAVSAAIEAQGGKLRHRRGRLHEVSIPAGRLSPLAAQLPAASLVRFSYPHQPLVVTGQGVALTGSGDMQALGNNGAGVRIGVIDLGFANLADSQASGDLPASLSVTDYTGTGTGGINHGTSVAEIVHEMAPGATLYLAKVATDVQLSRAVDDMIAAGVRVINHSVAWFGGAFYDGTGPFCDTVNSAHAAGIQWVNAMGNHRLKHYLGAFTDSDGDLRHEFAAGQNYNTISLTAGSALSLILNWDAYPSTSVDYDLYLYNGNPDSGGTLVASSTNRQSGKGPSWFPYPYEPLNYTPATSGTYYIVVKKTAASTPNLRLTLFSMGPDLATRITSSSIVQPADCANAIGAGATNLSDVPEGYSSEGPTTDGRAKPEISGPDGVKTSLSTGFYGTSAAAPHVAGAVALLMSQNPGFSLSQINWLLTGTAKDVSTPGFDYRTGNGRISLDADGDGYNHDIDNCRLVSNPTQADLDGDGAGDACDTDVDGDGLSNAQETALGTDPQKPDTDGDGLTDGAEVNTYGTSPLLMDTDADRLTDAQEVTLYGTNPNVSNTGDLAPRSVLNGVANAADLLILMRFVEGVETPTSRDMTLGDINRDGVLDVRDVFLLERQIGYH